MPINRLAIIPGWVAWRKSDVAGVPGGPMANGYCGVCALSVCHDYPLVTHLQLSWFSAFQLHRWRTQPAYGRECAAAPYIIALCSFQVADAIITIAAGIVISLMRNWKKHSRNHKDFHCARRSLSS